MNILEIVHNDQTDSIVIIDAITHDDVAEIFHNQRHTVLQTAEQALATAHMFAASYALCEVVEAMASFDGRNNNAALKAMARAALALARGEAA